MTTKLSERGLNGTWSPGVTFDNLHATIKVILCARFRRGNGKS